MMESSGSFRAGQVLCPGSILILVLALLMSVQGNASESGAREAFRKGVAAFEAGDHERARRYLEAAREQGLDSTALHYNLGVVHYRLGNYERARRSFRQLLDTSHAGIARYNLGLVALGEDEPGEAARWFREVTAKAGSDALKRKARERLRAVAGEKESGSTTDFAGLLSVGSGYEDNISRLPDSRPTSLSDSNTSLLAAGRLRHGALELSGAAYQQRYHSRDGFDTEYGRFGIGWREGEGRNRYSIGAQQAYVRYGGASRYWITSVEGDYRRLACLANRGVCGASLEVARVRPYDDYESRRGMRYRFETDYEQGYGSWRSRLHYRGEYNDRQDFESESFFISYSPTRHRIALRQRYLGFADVRLEGEASYRYSDYPDPFRLGATANGTRRDHRYELNLRARWRFSERWSLALRGRYMRNESSLERFDYQSHLGEVSFRLRL